ncbi:hypothetical protein J7T55_011110 [Diaporthe amygdali]|uniref:uncharacterized protein n=1 Tax=Phomopsis amygdali TaxID=1214568 RepID=UPI0022FEEAFD|nr:uncharacterized protein J7T55_011110 [Diaporthe amygdali]KAJ0104326.1 hypothetical protein J7T55_011110 [Diaporthe amygdali]
MQAGDALLFVRSLPCIQILPYFQTTTCAIIDVPTTTSLTWRRPGTSAPSHSPREAASSHFGMYTPVLPPSPGPASPRDRSSSRLCRCGPAGDYKPRVVTAMSTHDAEWTLIHRPAHGMPSDASAYGCCRYVAPPPNYPLPAAESAEIPKCKSTRSYASSLYAVLIRAGPSLACTRAALPILLVGNEHKFRRLGSPKALCVTDELRSPDGRHMASALGIGHQTSSWNVWYKERRRSGWHMVDAASNSAYLSASHLLGCCVARGLHPLNLARRGAPDAAARMTIGADMGAVSAHIGVPTTTTSHHITISGPSSPQPSANALPGLGGPSPARLSLSAIVACFLQLQCAAPGPVDL